MLSKCKHYYEIILIRLNIKIKEEGAIFSPFGWDGMCRDNAILLYRNINVMK